MPEISQIQMPSGTVYEIKDTRARSAKGWLGITTTVLTDGATTNPITINGESVTATSGGIASYDNKEFIFNGSAWQEFGDLSDLGLLAYKDSASGSFTPSGSVSLSNTNKTATVSKASSGTATYTPEGTCSGGNVTLNTTTVNSITNVGTLPSATMPSFSVSNETLVITNGSFDAGTLPTKGANVTVATGVNTVTQPTFTGTGARLVTGNISVPSSATFSGTAGTVTVS